MVQNKKNILRVMKKLETVVRDKICAYHLNNEPLKADRLSNELYGFQVAIDLLEDKEYFDRCVMIYNLEENDGEGEV